MASPTPKRPKPAAPDPFARYPPRPPRTGPPDLVDPAFLVKAFAGVVLAAVVLAYLSVCLLVYIGGWHRLLHPSATGGAVPSGPGLTVEPVRFGSAGKHMAAWWIPSDSANAPTILYLHDGDGALSYDGNLPLLHQAGVNVFAIDYRGYGQSDGPHPTQAHMQEDAAVALDYLLYTRHIPAAKIVPYGVGLGGALAANLASAHADLPALVIDQPRPDAYYQAVDAQQSHLLPMHLLLRERFDIGEAIAGVHQPKLLYARLSDAIVTDSFTIQGVFAQAPAPKMTVTFPASRPAATDQQYLTTFHRFIDESVK